MTLTWKKEEKGQRGQVNSDISKYLQMKKKKKGSASVEPPTSRMVVVMVVVV